MSKGLKKRIIGIIGGVGSGKDTAADYIVSKIGIESFQISQPLRDIAKDTGVEPTRENLIKIGSDLVKGKGAAYLAKLTLDKINGNIGIITGIRVVEVVEYLRENSDLILLAIISEPEVRFRRSTLRGKLGEAKTLENFIENERIENSPPNAQNLFRCMELADYKINNDSSLEDFHKEIDLFLEKKNIIKT